MRNACLTDLLHDLTQSDAKHLGRFQLDLHPATPTPHTDYQCLRIILSNLIDNAWRYGDARSPIVISTYPETDAAQRPGVCVSIANTTGIAAWPEPDKVFQKYYRSTGAKTISGTGLGLYLVRSLCTLLGGTCTYAPDETHVKFNVWLPN